MLPAAQVRWFWRISWLLMALAGPAYSAFEITGGGARSSGLGAAFTAGLDSEAIWFNPAANAWARKYRVGTAHAQLYPGLDESPNLNVLGAVLPLGGGSLQLGLSSLGVEDWREQVGLVGYGRALHQRFALGTSLRSSGWETRGLSHRVWSADLGATYKVGWIHPGFICVWVSWRPTSTAPISPPADIRRAKLREGWSWLPASIWTGSRSWSISNDAGGAPKCGSVTRLPFPRCVGAPCGWVASCSPPTGRPGRWIWVWGTGGSSGILTMPTSIPSIQPAWGAFTEGDSNIAPIDPPGEFCRTRKNGSAAFKW